jgi:hypothetical protein
VAEFAYGIEAGPGAKSAEAWTALVEIADAWSEYVMVRGILNHVVANHVESLALAGSATTDAGRLTRFVPA